MRRVIVCGGRDYANVEKVNEILSDCLWVDDVIVTGGARGADLLAQIWGWANDYHVEVHRADWEQYGRSAGPRRNQKMLDAGAQLVIAFPGGRGTAHMVKIARRADVAVISVNARDDD